MLSGRALLDAEDDRALYVERSEHREIRHAAGKDLNVLLVGDRGSGKTSLLRQGVLELRKSGTPVALVDGKLAPDADAFLELVRYELGGAPDLPEGATERYRRPPPWLGLGPVARMLDLIDMLTPPGSSSLDRITLIVDGLPSAEAAGALFGQFRDELARLPFNWVVSPDDGATVALLKPPGSSFFDRVIEMRPFSVSEQAELLSRRGSGDLAEALASAAGGNPRRLLALARDEAEQPFLTTAATGARKRQARAVAQLGRPARRLLAELEDLGAASASDASLLDRLGWTRGRASQVFAELQEAGLVSVEAEKGGGGRPRKVFRPLVYGPSYG